jgi:hypothetical protein
MRWTLGIPPYYIEVLMGHVGVGTTGHHYDKPSAEQMAKIVAKAWKEYIENGGKDPLA